MKKVFLVLGVVFFMAFQAGFVSAGKQITVAEKYELWLDKGLEAMPEMKKALKHKNFRMRTHAILGMAKTGEQEVIPLIIKALQEDDHAAVRNTAVYSLGLLKAKEAVPILIEMLPLKRGDKGYKRVGRNNIVEALGEIGDPAAARVLYDALYTRNRAMQLKVQKAIVAVNGIYAANQIIQEKARIKKYGLEKIAVSILGNIHVEGGEQYVSEISRTARGSTLNAAITALGKMKSDEALSLYYNGIKSTGKNAKLVVKKSIEALVKVNSQASVDPLIEIMELNLEGSINQPGPSRHAAKVLARMTQASIPVKVMEKLENNPSINSLAAYVLGMHKYAQAAPLLRQRLADENQPGQDSMAEALGMIKDLESIPLLMMVLKRHSLRGSSGAAWALGSMKATDAVPLLISLLEENSEIFEMVIDPLGSMKDKIAEKPLAVPLLSSLLNKNSEIFVRVIDALGSMKDRRAVKPLIDTYNNLQGDQFFLTGNSVYYLHIGSSLISLGGEQVRQFIIDCITNSSGNLWVNNRESLGRFMLSKMKDKKLIPFAVSLLDHNDLRIVNAAMVCLRANTDREYGRAASWKAWARSEEIQY